MKGPLTEWKGRWVRISLTSGEVIDRTRVVDVNEGDSGSVLMIKGQVPPEDAEPHSLETVRMVRGARIASIEAVDPPPGA